MVMKSKSVMFVCGRIHASSAKSWPGPKFTEAELETITRSSTPSKLKLDRTVPFVKAPPLRRVALLVPAESRPFVSARHQLIKFVGTDVHGGVTMVKIAFELVAMPRLLLT